MLRKLISIVKDFGDDMNRKNIPTFAASTAFFFILSVVPMLIMLCSIIPLTPITPQMLLTTIEGFIPEALNGWLENIVSDTYKNTIGTFSLAAVVMLWSAGKGMLALIRGLNAIHNVPEHRNYFYLRVIASFYTLAMLGMLLISLIINVFGNTILDLIFARFPGAREPFDFFMQFRFIATWVVMTFVFALLFTFVPSKKLRFREQLPGAAVTAVAWGVFSWGFSVYVEYSNFKSTYGNLATLVILMLWLYCCLSIVMVGAQINRYLKPAMRILRTKKKSEESQSESS